MPTMYLINRAGDFHINLFDSKNLTSFLDP